MSIAVLERVYQIRDKRLTPTAVAVLAFLSYKANGDDGSHAWPSIETIAKSCQCGKKSAIRALQLLMSLGYVRRSPDQRWNGRDPKTGLRLRGNYRTTLWDVLPDNFLTEDKSAATQAENAKGVKMTPSARSGGDGPAMAKGVKMTPSVLRGETHGDTATDAPTDANGVILSTSRCHFDTQQTMKDNQLSYSSNLKEKINKKENPETEDDPTPTGPSPDLDAYPWDDIDEPATEDADSDAIPDERRTVARRFVNLFVHARIGQGLSVRFATVTDLLATDTLAQALLREHGDADPYATMETGVDAMLAHADGWGHEVTSCVRFAHAFPLMMPDVWARTGDASDEAGHLTDGGADRTDAPETEPEDPTTPSSFAEEFAQARLRYGAVRDYPLQEELDRLDDLTQTLRDRGDHRPWDTLRYLLPSLHLHLTLWNDATGIGYLPGHFDRMMSTALADHARFRAKAEAWMDEHEVSEGAGRDYRRGDAVLILADRMLHEPNLGQAHPGYEVRLAVGEAELDMARPDGGTSARLGRRWGRVEAAYAREPVMV